MNELSRIDYCLSTVLSADAGIEAAVGTNVFVQVPPQPATQSEREALYPMALAAFMSSIDVQGISTSRAMTRALYQVVIVCQGAPDEHVYAGADRIDELVGKMRDLELVIGGETWVFNGRRESPGVMTERDDSVGLYFERRGGLYRVEAYRG